jgi:predicted transposase YbfD/YdcC
LNQIKVDDKSNEITAVPKLLETLNIRGYIVTTDTMDCQKEIARKIRQKRGDYVLALKNNHPDFCDDVKTYFEDKEL